jgi:hypothetical protein
MKKILVVTLEGTKNFGNRLQHYALQQVVKNCGCDVGSLMVRPAPVYKKTKIINMVKSIFLICGIRKYRGSVSQGKRTEKFLAFNKQYITNAVNLPVGKVRRADWDSYSFVITGSDQVWHNWHSSFIPDELSYYYLEFIDKAKRISYAPSFGFTAFPPEDIERHRRGLMGMHMLSCREIEGCKLIRELTGREAQKVLDPTLLLTANEWSEIEKKPSFKISNKYLLKFFLGEVTEEYQAEIMRLAKERGLQTIDINNKSNPKHYAIGPDEFVWLVHHADTICKDSFHASVFSITFECNLRVFKREQKGFKDLFGRLHDLLAPLGLMELVYGEGNGLRTTLSKGAKQYLDNEREMSLKYLKRSVNNNEN